MKILEERFEFEGLKRSYEKELRDIFGRLVIKNPPKEVFEIFLRSITSAVDLSIIRDKEGYLEELEKYVRW